MILGDVEEIVTTIELDEETFEEIFKVCSCTSIFALAERGVGLVWSIEAQILVGPGLCSYKVVGGACNSVTFIKN